MCSRRPALVMLQSASCLATGSTGALTLGAPRMAAVYTAAVAPTRPFAVTRFCSRQSRVGGLLKVRRTKKPGLTARPLLGLAPSRSGTPHLEEAVDTAHRELQARPGGAGHGLLLVALLVAHGALGTLARQPLGPLARHPGNLEGPPGAEAGCAEGGGARPAAAGRRLARGEGRGGRAAGGSGACGDVGAGLRCAQPLCRGGAGRELPAPWAPRVDTRPAQRSPRQPGPASRLPPSRHPIPLPRVLLRGGGGLGLTLQQSCLV